MVMAYNVFHKFLDCAGDYFVENFCGNIYEECWSLGFVLDFLSKSLTRVAILDKLAS